MIRLAILGSTGSIGRSALEVVRRHPDRFEVVALSAHSSVDALCEQATEFSPATVVVTGEDITLPERGARTGDWRRGADAMVALTTRPDVDVVVNALVGAAGLQPTLAGLGAGKRLALANKESLVAGGVLVQRALASGGGSLVPIDSEHSAILQCLDGAHPDAVARIVLTASGGPFRGWNPSRLEDVRPGDALRHPTWDMGAKITIDSATLANKALEVIEAHFLYDIPYDRIDVVVHPQSFVHSFVEFVDGSVLAQVGQPTMEIPILYALSHPARIADKALRTFDPIGASPLTFEPVDHEAFPLFDLGVGAGRAGGSSPAVYNAANEIAVQAFLDGRIGFPAMAQVVRSALDGITEDDPVDFDAVMKIDRTAREMARATVEALAGTVACTPEAAVPGPTGRGTGGRP